MATTTITIRMDENLKKQAEILFEDMGLNMTTAFTMFTKAVVHQNKIPFEICADPFYKKENQQYLQKTTAKLSSDKMTSAEAQAAINKMRQEAADMPEMTLDEINEEIRAARAERKAKQ